MNKILTKSSKFTVFIYLLLSLSRRLSFNKFEFKLYGILLSGEYGESISSILLSYIDNYTYGGLFLPVSLNFLLLNSLYFSFYYTVFNNMKSSLTVFVIDMMQKYLRLQFFLYYLKIFVLVTKLFF